MNETVEDGKEAGRDRRAVEARREAEVRRAPRLADGQSRSEELPGATKDARRSRPAGNQPEGVAVKSFKQQRLSKTKAMKF